MDLFVIFLLWQYKYTFYLDFWLCACALSTLTTIFCSSIRKARLILRIKATDNLVISHLRVTSTSSIQSIPISIKISDIWVVVVDTLLPSLRQIQASFQFPVKKVRRWRETLLSPVTYTLGAHGASVGPADVLLGLGEPHQNLRSYSPNLQDRTEQQWDTNRQCTDFELTLS